MLAIFEQATARAPMGLELMIDNSPKYNKDYSETYFETIDQWCTSYLKSKLSKLNLETGAMHSLGRGNGFIHERSPYSSFASRDGISVVLSGEVGALPGVDILSASHNAYVSGQPLGEDNDAQWLLDFYCSFLSEVGEMTELVLQSLAKIKGRFAFVIYDERRQRVLAARDKDGAQALYWGATLDGHLMLSTDLSLVDGCDPTATSFPPGTLYCNHGSITAVAPGARGFILPGGQWPGHLHCFIAGEHWPWKIVRPVPRVDSKGVLHGAVF